MSEDADQPKTPEPDPMDSLLGGLDLTPDWARGDPGIQSDSSGRDSGRGGRGGQGGYRGGGGPKAPGASSRRGLQGVRVKPRRDNFDGGGRQDGGPQDGRAGGDRRDPRGKPFVRLPVHVDFIPEKERLSKVVKVIRKSNRVYPMEQIAGKFMEDPAFLSIKYTVREHQRNAEDFSLVQCKANGLVFSDESACVQYIFDRGLGEYYESETREVPPPSGSFVCVGRHRGTGRLIGPPNWHGYQRNLETLRQEIAPNLPPEAFSGQIEMIHDAEVIEAWKTTASQQTFYRRKVAQPAAEPEAKAPAEPEAAAPEAPATAEPSESSELSDLSDPPTSPTPSEPESPPDTAETEPAANEAPYSLSREEVEAEFLREVVPDLMLKTRRAIMPGYLVPKMTDHPLISLTQHHLNRERDRPSSIVFALRPAFKHMRLHLFRHNKELMVCGTAPHPLPDDQKVAPEIRRIVDYVAENPGVQAKAALEALAKEATEPTPALVSHMHWLIEKGHLLEFFDGSLMLPARRGG